MNTLISHKQFIKMRDSGKFSKKFEGRHSYFLYLEQEETNKNKKELILEYLKKLVNDMEEIKEKIKIKNNAKKEREAFKRKANSGFNSPMKNKKSAKK